MSMYTCPKCGKKVWSESSRCMICGTSIEDVIYYNQTGMKPIEKVSPTAEPEKTPEPRKPIPRPRPVQQSQSTSQNQPGGTQNQSATTSHTTSRPRRKSSSTSGSKNAKQVTLFILGGLFLYFFFTGIKIFRTLHHDLCNVNSEEVVVTHDNNVYRLPNPAEQKDRFGRSQESIYSWRNQQIGIMDFLAWEQCYAMSSTEEVKFDDGFKYYLSVFLKQSDHSKVYVTLTNDASRDFRDNMTMTTDLMTDFGKYIKDNRLIVIDEDANEHIFDVEMEYDNSVARIKNPQEFIELIEDNKYIFFIFKTDISKRGICYMLYHLNGAHESMVKDYY